MSEENQKAEIKRLLRYAGASHPNPFLVLDLDMESNAEQTEFSAVSKSYRKIALMLHPDKCSLPHAREAFQVAEKAYKLINDEVVFENLKAAYLKKKEKDAETQVHVGPSGGVSALRGSDKVELPKLNFGSLSHLAKEGVSGDEERKQEIDRILNCKPNDYFFILDINPDTCDAEDVTKRYRFIAKSLHPDKCTLAKTKDAFILVEKAYKELSDEKKLIRYKAGYEQQRKRELADLQRRQALAKSRATGDVGDLSGLSDEERREVLLRAAVRQQQLEAARLAAEQERKRQREEKEKLESEKMNLELKRQKEEWDSMKLF